MSIVFLNGVYLPAEQAFVPVLDRGFIFGDGVYELIPVYGGHLFRINEHLQRLQNSLDAIRLKNPYSTQQWTKYLQDLINKNPSGDYSAYLQVTRGVAKRDHALPTDVQPTVFAMVNPIMPAKPEDLKNGIAAITCNDFRWLNCHIKAISLLPNVLLRQQAVDAGAVEAILIRDGEITEGAASNVFMVKNGVVITPPKGPYLLPGITRDLILELANQHNIPNQERKIPETEFQQADEIWISSSMKEVMPVTQLNSVPVGDGNPGPVWDKMYAAFQLFKQAARTGQQ